MALALLAVLAAIAVQAKPAPYGAIAGTIRDEESNAPLAGVSITVVGVAGLVTSAADGRYEIRAVPSGIRQLTIRRLGYQSRTLRALVPEEGTVQINVTLRASPVHLRALLVRGRPTDAVAVEAPVTVQSSASLWKRPSLAEPDPLAGLSSGEITIAPESPSGIHIRGGASDQTGFEIDGIPVFNPVHTAGMLGAWNPDALEVVTVSSGTRAHRLSGVITATTRITGDRLTVHGGVSSTQARATINGPIGVAGSGLLFSIRTGFPGTVMPDREASYLRGESGDWLARLDLPALGGSLRILAYGNENTVSTASHAMIDSAVSTQPRNGFEWHSASIGAEWRRAMSEGDVRVLVWRAATSVAARWSASREAMRLTGDRRDAGIEARVERATMGGRTEASLTVITSRTAYAVEDPGEGALLERARTPILTTRAQHTRALSRRLDVQAGASVAATGGALYAAPELHARWNATHRLRMTAALTRAHQFAQSLRNAESLAGGIFPVDLYLGSEHPAVPVARSDQAVIGMEYRPAPPVRLGASAWTRRFDGLLLAAPRGGAPFATDGFAVGKGSASGIAVDGVASTPRVHYSASYGLQGVRLRHGDAVYVPGYGVRQTLQGGVTLTPGTAFSLSLGATGIWGRRTTIATGALEWESCSLLDEGCEFAGSPDHTGFALGAMQLPAYFRADLGVRKEWGARIGGRDGSVAVFGTITNLFARRNVLTYVKDPAAGGLTAIEMRSRVPLVVGIDWRF